MAIPRIFISATCYDLQEICFQLRRFIQEVGYDPVMSEFGDIFYDLNALHWYSSLNCRVRRSVSGTGRWERSKPNE